MAACSLIISPSDSHMISPLHILQVTSDVSDPADTVEKKEPREGRRRGERRKGSKDRRGKDDESESESAAAGLEPRLPAPNSRMIYM